jgi:hypothetical protein
VADQDHGSTFAGDLAHLAETLLLERRVSDSEYLVDQQDVRVEVRGDREREAEAHSAGVPLHRRLDELFELRECDDLVELPRDLAPPHPEDGAVEVDVLAARELGVEAGADLEQRAHLAADHCAPGRRWRDAREDLQQG